MHEQDLGIAEAAIALGVSQDTLRRWERNGKLATRRDSAGHRRIAASEIQRLHRHTRSMPSITAGANQLVGVVRRVERGRVMAQVDLDAGPFAITAVLPDNVVVAQRLAPGVPVTAIVNVAEVSIERSG
jgi:excisionase family DNA binding protein